MWQATPLSPSPPKKSGDTYLYVVVGSDLNIANLAQRAYSNFKRDDLGGGRLAGLIFATTLQPLQLQAIDVFNLHSGKTSICRR